MQAWPKAWRCRCGWWGPLYPLVLVLTTFFTCLCHPTVYNQRLPQKVLATSPFTNVLVMLVFAGWGGKASVIPRFFSNLFVYFTFSSFAGVLKPFSGKQEPPPNINSLTPPPPPPPTPPPPVPPHTYPSAVRNDHTGGVPGSSKSHCRAGSFFLSWLGSSLTCLGRARKGNGWTSRSAFPQSRPGSSQPSVFALWARLVRQRGPSGSNKSSVRLHNWNRPDLFGDAITDALCGFSFFWGVQRQQQGENISNMRAGGF